MTKKKTTSEKQSTQSNNNNGSISKESMALAQILDDVQHSFARHAKHLVTVKKMLQEDELKFSDVFMPMLNQILPIYKREMSVERLVKFIVKIGDGSTDGKPNEKFALGLIRYLLNYVDAKDKGVRFRCLQMVAGLIAGVQEIEEDLFDNVLKRVPGRCQDKMALIRSQAVAALARFQNPTDANDIVTTQYIDLLENDESSDVRISVLSHIGLSKLTLPHIIRRTRDVKETVRKAAYEILSKKVKIKSLQISQRLSVLKDGMNDRDEIVRKAADNLLKTWIEGAENDFLKFLAFLHVESAEDTIEPIILHILKHNMAPIPEGVKNVRKVEDLTPEFSILWRIFLFQTKKENPTQFEDIAPDANVLRAMLTTYFEQAFIWKQVMMITSQVDLADEHTRQLLSSTLRDLLSKHYFLDTSVQIVLEFIKRCSSSQNDFERAIIEVLAELREPLDQYREHGVDADGVIEELEDKIKSLEQQEKDLTKSRSKQTSTERQQLLQSVQEELQTAREKFETMNSEKQERLQVEELLWLRALILVSKLLENASDQLDEDLWHPVVESTIKPAVMSEIPSVADLGLKCFGMICSLNLQHARNTIRLFKKRVQSDADETIRCTALRSIFDLVLLFGPALCPEITEEESEQAQSKRQLTFTDLIDLLRSGIQDDSAAIRTVSIEGVSKLLLNQVPKIPLDLFVDLFSFYFESKSDDDSKGRQCLSVFFPSYFFTSSQRQIQIADVFVGCVEKFVEKSEEIDLTKSIEYLFWLADSSNVQKKDKEEQTQGQRNVRVSDMLTLRLADRIIAGSEEKQFPIKKLLKVLMAISVVDIESQKQLYNKFGQILLQIPDKITLKTAIKHRNSMAVGSSVEEQDPRITEKIASVDIPTQRKRATTSKAKKQTETQETDTNMAEVAPSPKKRQTRTRAAAAPKAKTPKSTKKTKKVRDESESEDESLDLSDGESENDEQAKQEQEEEEEEEVLIRKPKNQKKSIMTKKEKELDPMDQEDSQISPPKSSPVKSNPNKQEIEQPQPIALEQITKNVAISPPNSTPKKKKQEISTPPTPQSTPKEKKQLSAVKKILHSPPALSPSSGPKGAKKLRLSSANENMENVVRISTTPIKMSKQQQILQEVNELLFDDSETTNTNKQQSPKPTTTLLKKKRLASKIQKEEIDALLEDD